MDWKDVENLAHSEVVFAVLFILVLVFVGKFGMKFIQDVRAENQQREEQLIELYKGQIENSEKREGELMNHLGKSNEQLSSIAGTLKEVQKGLLKLEQRVDDNFLAVWKELGGKADKTNIQK